MADRQEDRSGGVVPLAEHRARRAADLLAERFRDQEARRLADYLASMGEIADRIRAAISDSGLSLNELAKRSGVDDGVLSRFMRDERSMTIDTLERLSGVLGLSVAVRKGRRRAKK